MHNSTDGKSQTTVEALLPCPVCGVMSRSQTPRREWIMALKDAAENVVIAHGMGWDMEGVIEKLQEALNV